MVRARVGRRVGAVLGMGFLGLLAGGPTVAAEPGPAGNPQYGVYGTLGARCVDVRFDDPAQVTIVQRRDGATIKTVQYLPSGDDEVCLKPLKPGDQIRLRQGGVLIRTAVVPTLGLQVDRGADRIEVQLPAGGSLEAYLSVQDRVAGSVSGDSIGANHDADPDGSYELDATGVLDIGAGDPVRLSWNEGLDSWTITRQTASVAVRYGVAAVGGSGAIGSTATITLRKPNGTVRGRARATRIDTRDGLTGEFQRTLRKAGDAVPVKAGNRIRHSQTSKSFTVPPKSLVVDGTGQGSLTVTCPANGQYVVLVDDLRVDAGGSGDGSVVVNDLGGSLTSGTVVAVHCDNRRGYGIVQQVVLD